MSTIQLSEIYNYLYDKPADDLEFTTSGVETQYSTFVLRMFQRKPRPEPRNPTIIPGGVRQEVAYNLANREAKIAPGNKGLELLARYASYLSEKDFNRMQRCITFSLPELIHPILKLNTHDAHFLATRGYLLNFSSVDKLEILKRELSLDHPYSRRFIEFLLSSKSDRIFGYVVHALKTGDWNGVYNYFSFPGIMERPEYAITWMIIEDTILDPASYFAATFPLEGLEDTEKIIAAINLVPIHNTFRTYAAKPRNSVTTLGENVSEVSPKIYFGTLRDTIVYSTQELSENIVRLPHGMFTIRIPGQTDKYFTEEQIRRLIYFHKSFNIGEVLSDEFTAVVPKVRNNRENVLELLSLIERYIKGEPVDVYRWCNRTKNMKKLLRSVRIINENISMKTFVTSQDLDKDITTTVQITIDVYRAFLEV